MAADLSQRILDAARAAGASGVMSADLRALLGPRSLQSVNSACSPLVLAGQLVAAPWDPDDGDAPERLVYRIAPPGTPTLEQRILETFVAAGIEGLDEDDLLEELSDALGIEAESDVVDAASVPLFERGAIRRVGCGWFALTPAEWARRIMAEVRSGAAAFGLGAQVVEDAVAVLLAGGRHDAVASAEPTPVVSTLRTGEPPTTRREG